MDRKLYYAVLFALIGNILDFISSLVILKLFKPYVREGNSFATVLGFEDVIAVTLATCSCFIVIFILVYCYYLMYDVLYEYNINKPVIKYMVNLPLGLLYGIATTKFMVTIHNLLLPFNLVLFTSIQDLHLVFIAMSIFYTFLLSFQK